MSESRRLVLVPQLLSAHWSESSIASLVALSDLSSSTGFWSGLVIGAPDFHAQQLVNENFYDAWGRVVLELQGAGIAAHLRVSFLTSNGPFNRGVTFGKQTLARRDARLRGEVLVYDRTYFGYMRGIGKSPWQTIISPLLFGQLTPEALPDLALEQTVRTSELIYDPRKQHASEYPPVTEIMIARPQPDSNLFSATSLDPPRILAVV